MNVIKKNDMKRIILIFVTILIVSFAPPKKEKHLKYFFINSQSIIPSFFGYKAYFSIKSIDPRFQRDNYYFRINYPDFEDHTLSSLGREIDIDTINYIDPQKYYRNKPNCEVHEELSLERDFLIVTQLPKSNKDIVFFARYAGTNKDVVHTQSGFPR